MKVSDEVVEVALDVVLGEGVVDCSTDTMRRVIRAALEAALPLVLGEPVAWVDEQAVEKLRSGRTAIETLWPSDPDGRVKRGQDFIDHIPIYAPKERANER